jgi:membrane protease YdiL (CAAX protease family)
MKYLNSYSAILVFIIWTAITLGPNVYLLHGKTKELGEGLGNGPAYNILAAASFILLVTFLTKNANITGLVLNDVKNLKILFFQIAVILITAFYLGYNYEAIKVNGLAWTFINCIFIGISEEMMFRGVLLSSFVKTWSFRKAAIAVTLIFGSVHVLNALITGELAEGFLQAFMAMCSGILLLAYRVKNLTIVFAIVLHTIWDFVVFLLSDTLKMIKVEKDIVINLSVELILIASPIAFGVYGLYLLTRKNAANEYIVTQKINN